MTLGAQRSLLDRVAQMIDGAVALCLATVAGSAGFLPGGAAEGSIPAIRPADLISDARMT